MRRRDAVYYYHRATGRRLPDDYGSPAFARAWAEAETLGARRPITGPDPASYDGLVAAFKTSAAWDALAPRTRADYAKAMDWIVGQGGGPRAAALLDHARAEKLLDKASATLAPRQALYLLQVQRRLWNWVLERADRRALWGQTNPWGDLKPPKRERSDIANRAWSPSELATVLARAPLGLRRAYVLGAAGFDGSTMWDRRWEEYRNGAIPIRRVKTGNAGLALIPAPLRPWLEEGPRHLVYIVTAEDGEPLATLNRLQTWSSAYLRGLAADGVVGAGLTLHGLRHTLGKALAERGAGLPAIQAALQHASARMALHYSAEADKHRALREAQDGLAGWFSGE